jgi:hypothetical protein
LNIYGVYQKRGTVIENKPLALIKERNLLKACKVFSKEYKGYKPNNIKIFRVNILRQ